MNTDFISGEGKAKQRAAVLKWLRREPLTSLEARERLGVLHCAGRIMELRRDGHQIDTVRCTAADAEGRLHPVAQYVLKASETQAHA